jgi:hypothetical protein
MSYADAVMLFGPGHGEKMQTQGQEIMIYQEPENVYFGPAPDNPADMLKDMRKSRHTYRLTEVMNNDLGEECYVYMHDSTCCEVMYQDPTDKMRETLAPGRDRFKKQQEQDVIDFYQKIKLQENRPRPTVDEFYAANLDLKPMWLP